MKRREFLYGALALPLLPMTDLSKISLEESITYDNWKGFDFLKSCEEVNLEFDSTDKTITSYPFTQHDGSYKGLKGVLKRRLKRGSSRTHMKNRFNSEKIKEHVQKHDTTFIVLDPHNKTLGFVSPGRIF